MMIRAKRTYHFNTSAAIIAALVLNLAAPGAPGQSKTNALTSIGLVVNYPVFLLKGDSSMFFNLRDTLSICYYNDCILYHLAPVRHYETNEKIPGTGQYFIYRKDSRYGYLFESLSSRVKSRKLPVDSFLFKRGFKGPAMDKSPNDTLVGIEKNKKEGLLLEKYIPKIKFDETIPDSTCYYFTSRFNDVLYSFSPKLDNSEKMKLYKIRMIYNENVSVAYKKTFPKREISFEIIKHVSVPDENAVIDFFNRFNREENP